jgi:hypothetical protein
LVNEGRRQEAEGRRQKAGGRRQKAGGRRQEAEGRRQEAEGRRQKVLEEGGIQRPKQSKKMRIANVFSRRRLKNSFFQLSISVSFSIN